MVKDFVNGVSLFKNNRSGEKSSTTPKLLYNNLPIFVVQIPFLEGDLFTFKGKKINSMQYAADGHPIGKEVFKDKKNKAQ